MMPARLSLVYAPKPRHLGSEPAWREWAKRCLALDFAHEREFCPWLHANGHLRLIYGAKAACERMSESSRDELIAHFGWA
jgi:hypothetical protein